MAMTRILAAAVLAALAGSQAGAEQSLPAPLGQAPEKARALSVVPNAQAIDRIIWMPQLDEGWVPQGLTVAEGHLIVSAYRAKTAERTASCRLWRIDPASGAVGRPYDIPAACSHAGGLAYLGANRLLVADTAMLFEIDLDRAFKGDAAAIKHRIALAGELRGSYVTSRQGAPWIGAYNRTADSRIFALTPDKLTAARLNDKDAVSAIPLPQKAQGAAFSADGQLWVSASSGTFGKLYRIDPANGRILTVHEVAAGIEDLSFDGEGRLWAVSEAGAGPYGFWSTYFPVLFRIDVAKLR